MPSNNDANPKHSTLKGVRTGFHVAGYLVKTLGQKLGEKVLPNSAINAIKNANDSRKGYTRIPEGETTTFNVGGQDVQLPKKFMGNKLPPGKSIDTLQREVQDKINAGERLLSDIQNGTAPQTCSMKDMTDLMTYMQAKAQIQGGNFHEGSMSIPDPGNKIKNFLDTCPEAYQRKSSHIGEFQNQTDAKGTHRGIDAYGRTKKPDEMLPNNKKTVMYGSMNSDAPGMKMKEDRLWLKMEPHGAWAFSPKVNDPNGPQRTANRHDGKAAVGHSLSFLETRGQGSKAGTRKERIPDDIKAGWTSLQKLAREELKGTNQPKELTDMLRKGEGLQTARGVRFINEYLNTLKGTEALSPEVRDQAKFMQNVLKERFPKETMDVRIGNEVILTDNELKPRNKKDIPGPSQDLKQGNGVKKGSVGALGEDVAKIARNRVK